MLRLASSPHAHVSVLSLGTARQRPARPPHPSGSNRPIPGAIPPDKGLIPGLPREQTKDQGFWEDKRGAQEQMKALTAVSRQARTPKH